MGGGGQANEFAILQKQKKHTYTQPVWYNFLTIVLNNIWNLYPLDTWQACHFPLTDK